MSVLDSLTNDISVEDDVIEYDIESVVQQYPDPSVDGELPSNLSEELMDFVRKLQSAATEETIRYGRQWVEAYATNYQIGCNIAKTIRSTVESINSVPHRLHLLYLVHDVVQHEVQAIRSGENREVLLVRVFKPYLVWVLRAAFRLAYTARDVEAQEKIVRVLSLWLDRGIIDDNEKREMHLIMLADTVSPIENTSHPSLFSKGRFFPNDSYATHDGEAMKVNHEISPPPPPPLMRAMPLPLMPQPYLFNSPFQQFPYCQAAGSYNFTPFPGPPLPSQYPISQYMSTTQSGMEITPIGLPPPPPPLPFQVQPNQVYHVYPPPVEQERLLNPENIPVGVMATMMKQLSKRGKNMQTAFVPFRPLDPLMTPQSLPPLEIPTEYILERVNEFYEDLKNAEAKLDEKKSEIDVKRATTEHAHVTHQESSATDEFPTEVDLWRPDGSYISNSTKFDCGGDLQSENKIEKTGLSDSDSVGPNIWSKHRDADVPRSRSSSPIDGKSKRSKSSSEERAIKKKTRDSKKGGGLWDKPIAWAQAEMGVGDDGSVISDHCSRTGERFGLGAGPGSASDVFEKFRKQRSSLYHDSIASKGSSRR